MQIVFLVLLVLDFLSCTILTLHFFNLYRKRGPSTFEEIEIKLWSDNLSIL